MHPMVEKTFGGLSRAYYCRQLFFGLLFPIMVLTMASASHRPTSLSFSMLTLLTVNTLLYPYARFVYEGIVGFLLGDNVLFVNAFLMLLVKFITMSICWAGAIFIAPVGLLYLYFHHSRASAPR